MLYLMESQSTFYLIISRQMVMDMDVFMIVNLVVASNNESYVKSSNIF